MIKLVESCKLNIAISKIKDGEITFAKLNGFVVKLGQNDNVRMYYENNDAGRSVPLENDFACFIETFEKNDLKPGMIVETRCGDVFIVIDNFLANKNDFIDFENYHDSLAHKLDSDYDIHKIYMRESEYGLHDLLDLGGVKILTTINLKNVKQTASTSRSKRDF
jgi:hypothetical protein